MQSEASVQPTFRRLQPHGLASQSGGRFAEAITGLRYLLLQVAGGLVIGWTLMTVMGILPGGERGQPAWAYEAIFASPNAAPCAAGCLLGIAPGMSREASLNRLQQHPLMAGARRSSPYTGVTLLETADGIAATLFVGANATAGYYVQIEWLRAGTADPSHQPPRLGDIVLRFGAPRWVAAARAGCDTFILLGFEPFTIALDFVAALRPSTPVRSIYINTTVPHAPLTAVDWAGFSRTWRYGIRAEC